MRRLARLIVGLLRELVFLSVRPWRSETHLTRYAMYSALRTVVEKSDKRLLGEEPSALSIGHSVPLLTEIGLGHVSVTEANYPEHDMASLVHFSDNAFDVVVSDQVLEHVDSDPFLAIAESFRVVRPGGLVVHTTCLLNPIHYGPKDLWRFTPSGLALLASQYGTVLESGGWGNIPALFMLVAGLRHVPTPPDWHPIGKIARRNRPSWPIMTWVVARR